MGGPHRIIFTPSGIRAQADEGRSVFDVALEAGVDIQSICGGRGLCNRCQIELEPGEHAKFKLSVAADSLGDLTETERLAMERGRLASGRRLACRTRICGDAVIEVPGDARQTQSVISKASVAFSTELKPAVKLYMCKLPRPELDDNPSDAEALAAQLRAFGVEARCNHRTLIKLQPTLAQNDRELIAVVRDGAEVIDVWPPSPFDAYGAAIDIGSTSLALYLYDLTRGELAYEASAMNPQIRFGEDLMSRVSYVMMNKGGEARLTAEIRKAVAKMLEDARKALDLGPNQILEVVAVGNPIMHHLFLGINPVELGQAPFTLAVKDWFEAPASNFDLGISETARVSMLPLVGGHVGADTTGAYLSQMSRMQGRSVLLVDIGTNAEIVLTHNGRAAAASSPTGPAFEGAEISAGVRASPGAIERIRIAPDTGRVTFKVIGKDAWFCDEEDDLTAERITGICGSGIFEVMVELANAGFVDAGGLFQPERCPARFEEDGKSWRFRLVDRGEASLYVKQTDVRAVQLAKAALAAGVELLSDYLDCRHFDEVLLAGAFGAHLDPAYVAQIGIIPGATAENVSSVGNAAGVGAAMALFNVDDKARIIEATRHIEKVETATEPRFQDYFVRAMSFPTAPVAADDGGGGRGRRSGRRARG
jgi:uncharacterized 2Fe-2S/4Fe-4S cluster protein (DUF4445 family)